MKWSAKKTAFRSRSVLAVLVLLTVSSAATAADYPRRLAIAPFTILGSHEEIRQTVAILPRLLSSRLMAMTGADVLVLSPEQTPPADAAKKAGLPLLLDGSVTKLGAGYSIDLTVTDLTTGKMAGAFFVAANTQDDIIPRLGDLAADVSEKLFGVRAARAYPPSPAAPPQAAAPAPAAVAVAPVPVPSGGAGTAAAEKPEAAPAPASPDTLKSGWKPSSFVMVSQSTAIPDDVYGVVTGDIDSDGNGEVIAYGKDTLYIYRVKDEKIVPYTKVKRSFKEHIIGVNAIDLDADGQKEILVTNLGEDTDRGGNSVKSFVLKRNGDVYKEVAGNIPYFLAVLPDWKGKPVVVGQYEGFETPFLGKIVPLDWDGKGFTAGEPFPQRTDIIPLSQGLPGLSSARFNTEWKLLYTDVTGRIRILDNAGIPIYKSQDLYGSGLNSFKWGPVVPIEDERRQYQVRTAPRPAPGGGEFPLVLIPEVKKGMLDIVQGFYDSTRLVLLQWDGGDFLESVGTKSTGHFVSGADFLSPSDLKRGDKVVASVIEQVGNVLKGSVSRLIVYRLE
jgi:hypothetical protein